MRCRRNYVAQHSTRSHKNAFTLAMLTPPERSEPTDGFSRLIIEGAEKQLKSFAANISKTILQWLKLNTSSVLEKMTSKKAENKVGISRADSTIVNCRINENEGSGKEEHGDTVWSTIIKNFEVSLSEVQSALVIDQKKLLELIVRANTAYLKAIQSVQDHCIAGSLSDKQKADSVAVQLSLLYAKAVRTLTHELDSFTDPQYSPNNIESEPSDSDSESHRAGTNVDGGGGNNAATEVRAESTAEVPQPTHNITAAGQYSPTVQSNYKTNDDSSDMRRGKQLVREGDKYVYK